MILSKIKIYLNNKEGTTLIENNYPLSIKLKSLKLLLIPKIRDNFCFTFNGKLIQSQEENSFTLQNVVKNNLIHLLFQNLNIKPDENLELKNNDNKDNQVLKNRKYNLNENKFDFENNHKTENKENYEKMNNEN